MNATQTPFPRGFPAALWRHARGAFAALMRGICARMRESGGARTGPDRFSSLASMIPGVVYQRIVMPNGDIRYTYMSEGAREMFGVSPEEVLRDPEILFGKYSEDYKASFRQRLMEASRTLTKWDVEASIVRPDGRIRYTHAIAKPERLPDGSVLWTGLILDATRTKQAEEELKAANRSVEAANRAKSMFLANMSHEIRTPMNGVLGMADLMSKTELNGRQRRLLSTLMHSSRTLLAIINDVLDISRIEAGTVKLESQDFDLYACIEDAVELCAGDGYRKGLEVSLLADHTLPARVRGDQGRLRQVMINLVGNAIKFTATGEVVVRAGATTASDGRALVAIEVRDTGIGIEPSAIDNIFAPFAQADTTISRRFGGTGLGLTITRHLIELMGGRISLESEPGAGTTVRFELPYDVGQQQGGTAVRAAAGKRIMIVDDRETTREMIAMHLAGCGAFVEFASCGETAYDRLAAAAEAGRPYDVAIIDRVKASVDNFDLCRRLRSHPGLARTAVLLIVSINYRGDADQERSLGAAGILTKPIRRNDLISAVGTALAGASQGVAADLAGRGAEQDGIKDDLSTDTVRTSERGAMPAGTPVGGRRVLLVEDNPVNQEVAREYLSGFGCEVEVANNGVEAIEAFDRDRFDIILMDCQMPELDGLSATRRIRESERRRGVPRTPIIAVTANAYDSDRADALEAGMDEHLSKPFTDAQLLDVVERWALRQSGTAVATCEPGAAVPTSRCNLDEDLLGVLLTSRPEFLERLLQTFMASAAEVVGEMRHAASRGEVDTLARLAHGLRSASANAGAKQLSELSHALEAVASAGAEAEDCAELVAAIEQELGEIMPQLSRMRERAQSAQAA